ATFVSDRSTASEMALQNPVTNTPVSWTYLQFNFKQPLTNAGGTIPLVVNPNVAYTPYCSEDYSPTCMPPPASISQESFALHAGAAAAGFISVGMRGLSPLMLGVIVPVLVATYFTYKTYLDKVNELNSALHQVNNLAYYDALTNLPNRLLFT